MPLRRRGAAGGVRLRGGAGDGEVGVDVKDMVGDQTKALSMTDKRCVHCLSVLAEETADHWFPRAWYPSSTPDQIAKWSFPSCAICNGELGVIEDRLRHRLALGIDPESLGGRGIVDSALRSMDPDRAKNDRDRRARAARRAALERDLLPGDQLPLASALPGLGPSKDLPLDSQLGTYVHAGDIERFIRKLIRGLTYLQLEQYIEARHTIDVRFYNPGDAHLLTDYLDRRAEVLERGPGIRARVARVSGDPVTAAYEFIIWGQLTAYGLVLPTERPGLSAQPQASSGWKPHNARFRR